ncbi:hypothetical protein Tco_0292087 [Tanacetum coccineum]
MKCILKYLKGTTYVGLVYGRDQWKHMDVDGFIDAYYAKDLRQRWVNTREVYWMEAERRVMGDWTMDVRGGGHGHSLVCTLYLEGYALSAYMITSRQWVKNGALVCGCELDMNEWGDDTSVDGICGVDCLCLGLACLLCDVMDTRSETQLRYSDKSSIDKRVCVRGVLCQWADSELEFETFGNLCDAELDGQRVCLSDAYLGRGIDVVDNGNGELVEAVVEDETIVVDYCHSGHDDLRSSSLVLRKLGRHQNNTTWCQFRVAFSWRQNKKDHRSRLLLDDPYSNYQVDSASRSIEVDTGDSVVSTALGAATTRTGET